MGQRVKGRGDGQVSRFPRVALAAGLALLTGCGVANSTGLTPDAPSTMTVTSAVFSQGVLPQHFTCHGAKVSPPLDWSGSPSATKSYAIVVDDSAAPITPYIYWIVFNIPQATTDLQAAHLPPGAQVAENSLGQAKYDAPCPDSPGHSYRFTVYALDKTLNLANGASTQDAWQAIANAAIARGRVAVRANP
jgi:Raf kinase inhibitor-like YbhB/YbcL family protein